MKQKKAGRSSRVKLSASLEDYLEAIFDIAREQGVARVSQIAKRLRVGKPSVTAALKTLSEKDFVNYEAYQFITLTERGREIAKKVLWKHKILKRFLTEVLDVDDDMSNDTACKLEHVMGDEILGRLLCFIQFVNNFECEGKSFSELLGKYCEHGRPEHLCKKCSELQDLEG